LHTCTLGFCSNDLFFSAHHQLQYVPQISQKHISTAAAKQRVKKQTTNSATSVITNIYS